MALARSGRSANELSKEFGVTRQTITNWLRQDDLDAGLRSDGLTSEERVELSRLRRESKQLKMEREILSKAAAWFAREAEPSVKRSDS
jgi:transposase